MWPLDGRHLMFKVAQSLAKLLYIAFFFRFVGVRIRLMLHAPAALRLVQRGPYP